MNNLKVPIGRTLPAACLPRAAITAMTSSESGRFRLTAATRARLEDIGANILHPRQDRVSLRDLFVYPDLLPLNTDVASIQEKLERPISAETLIFNSEISHALLEGENSSGKSALLKMYFSEFYQRGKIPLLLRGGKSAFRGSDALRALIKRSYHATYVGEDYTQFEQRQPSERVLLIDEFEFAGANEESHEDVFKFLHQFSDKCIVVTKENLSLERRAATRTGASVLRKFGRYSIQEFGHVKRDELIKRWIL